MSVGLVIKTDGTVEDFNKAITLDHVREAIDVKIIEHVTLNNEISCYVDEEGLLKSFLPTL